MSRKYNSTTNAKCIYNPKILNLKSTSQRINTDNIPNEHNYKNNNNIQDQKSNGDISLDNNLMNYSKNEKSSNIKQNSINDDTSLDNISNIISQKQNNLPNTQMLFEDNESLLNEKQIITNSNQTKNKYNFKTLNSFSNTNFSKNNNIEVCDSHTKSFQLKMKKMKEMNRTILKDNYIKKNKQLNDSNKSENTFNSNDINNLKYINKCKQKIIHMKNKNKLLGKMNGFNSFNSHLDDKYKNNLNKKDGIKVSKVNSFLCCIGNSHIK